MLLYQASLDTVVSLGDIEDEGNLVASELEQVVVNVSECIGTPDSDVIQVDGSDLKELLDTSLTRVGSEPGL